MTAAAVPSHVFVVFIKATPERIWNAITQSEFTLQYYFASTVESQWTAGADYTYLLQGQPGIVGTVLESDPPRRLAMTFDARWDEEVTSDPPSRIAWEIEPAGDELSKLTVVHDGFESESHTYRQVGGGTPLILSGLKTLLETGQPLHLPAGVA